MQSKKHIFNVVVRKLVGTPSRVYTHSFQTRSFHGTNKATISSLRLVGYVIDGAAGTFPEHLRLNFPELNNGTTTLEFDEVNGTRSEAQHNYVFIFPPGGSETQSYTGIELLNLHAGHYESFVKFSFEIEARGSTGYSRFSDFTELVLIFEVTF